MLRKVDLHTSTHRFFSSYHQIAFIQESWGVSAASAVGAALTLIILGLENKRIVAGLDPKSLNTRVHTQKLHQFRPEIFILIILLAHLLLRVEKNTILSLFFAETHTCIYCL